MGHEPPVWEPGEARCSWMSSPSFSLLLQQGIGLETALKHRVVRACAEHARSAGAEVAARHESPRPAIKLGGAHLRRGEVGVLIGRG